MKRLMDVACPNGHVEIDVWVDGNNYPQCKSCMTYTQRNWAFAKAPGITPQGTRTEINTDGPAQRRKVDTQAIALETKREVEDKWLRFGDEKVAEAHVKREIDHNAGICDVAGNEVPLPKQDPIVFNKPTSAECGL